MYDELFNLSPGDLQFVAPTSTTALGAVPTWSAAGKSWRLVALRQEDRVDRSPTVASTLWSVRDAKLVRYVVPRSRLWGELVATTAACVPVCCHDYGDAFGLRRTLYIALWSPLCPSHQAPSIWSLLEHKVFGSGLGEADQLNPPSVSRRARSKQGADHTKKARKFAPKTSRARSGRCEPVPDHLASVLERFTHMDPERAF